jgi:hypothetical protein
VASKYLADVALSDFCAAPSVKTDYAAKITNRSPQGSDAKLIEIYEYQARGCMQNAEMAADSNLRHLLLKTAP